MNTGLLNVKHSFVSAWHASECCNAKQVKCIYSYVPCRSFANVTLNSSSSCRAKCPSVRLPCHCGRASLPPPLSLQSGWKRRRSSSLCLPSELVRKMNWLSRLNLCRGTWFMERTNWNCWHPWKVCVKDCMCR